MTPWEFWCSMFLEILLIDILSINKFFSLASVKTFEAIVYMYIYALSVKYILYIYSDVTVCPISRTVSADFMIWMM